MICILTWVLVDTDSCLVHLVLYLLGIAPLAPMSVSPFQAQFYPIVYTTNMTV